MRMHKICLKGVLQVILTLFFFSSIAYSQQRIQGYVERGGFQYSGSVSARVQRSYPNATVTVYLAGTTTLASIFTDSTLATPKSNPFTADSDGYYYFYSTGGSYDLRFSGGTILDPFVLGDIRAGSSYSLSTRIVYASALSGIHLNSDVTSGGGSDDTTILQTALNTAPTVGELHLIMDGASLVSGLKVYSNTTIEGINNGGLFLATGANKPTIQNAHRTGGSIIDSNIVIKNITINHNTNGQSKFEGAGSPPVAPITSGMTFFGVNNLTLDNIKSIDARGYNTWAANVHNLITNNLWLVYTGSAVDNHDGLHINGPASNVVINNTRLTGLTDDGIAISPDDDPNAAGGQGLVLYGNIIDVSIDNLNFDRTFYGVRVLCNTHRLEQMYIHNVYGFIQDNVLKLDDYSYIIGSGVGNIGMVTLDGMNVNTYIQNPQDFIHGEAIEVGANVDVLNLRNIIQGTGWYDDYRPILRVDNFNVPANTGHGNIHLLNADFQVFDPSGLGIDSSNMDNRITIEGNVDICNYNINHYRDSSVTHTLGAIHINSPISTNGLGTLNISGIVNYQNNTIALTGGKLGNVNLNGLIDINNAGGMFFFQPFTIISQYPTINGRGSVIGGNFLTGPNASSAILQTVSLNGNSRVAGDLQIPTQGKGVVLRATDGVTCYRLTVNNTGTVATTSVTCPQ
jgi:hypothetical protein